MDPAHFMGNLWGSYGELVIGMMRQMLRIFPPVFSFAYLNKCVELLLGCVRNTDMQKGNPLVLANLRGKLESAKFYPTPKFPHFLVNVTKVDV